MRLKVEIDDLTPEQWDQAQKTLKTSYDVPENASRVCLTLIHGNEERHVETPVGALTGLLTGLNLGQAFKAVGEAVKMSTRHVREPFNPVAVATLTPDDERLPEDRSVLGPKWNQEYQARTGDRLPAAGRSDHAPDGDVTGQDRDA